MWIVPSGDRRHRVLVEAGLVQRVGVDLDLEIELVANIQRRSDHGGHRAPVLVNLQSNRAGLALLHQRLRRMCTALAEKTEVDRERLCGLKHSSEVDRTRGADSDGDRPKTAAQHGCDARRDGLLAQSGGVEMHVDVDAAGGRDHALGGAHVRVRADHHAGGDVHGVGIARLAERGDSPVLDPDVALDDPRYRVDHDDVGDHEVKRSVGGGRKPVGAETVAQGLCRRRRRTRLPAGSDRAPHGPRDPCLPT